MASIHCLSVVRHFQRSSLKALCQTKANFMQSLSEKGGIKVCTNGPGPMIKLATMPT